MDKKIFGIRIGTILTALVCFITAVVIWIYVEYDKALDSAESAQAQEVDE